jgi:hypothetical protein
MMGDVFVLVDDAGRIGRVDPVHDLPGDAVHFDRDAVGEHEKLTVEAVDGLHALRWIASGRVGGLSPAGVWETWGDVQVEEKLTIGVWADGRIMVTRLHEGRTILGGYLRKVA